MKRLVKISVLPTLYTLRFLLFLALVEPHATSAVAEFHLLQAHLRSPACLSSTFFLSSLKLEREVQTGRSDQAKMGQIG